PTAPAPWTAPGCASPPGSDPGASAPDGGQVVADPVDGVDQDLHRRQGDQPEVVVGAQVEAGALREQQLAGPQQVVGELLNAFDAVQLQVQLREHVQRSLWLVHADARVGGQPLVGGSALLEQAAAGQHQALDGLLAAECGGHDVLRGDIGAQAHVGQHVQAL